MKIKSKLFVFLLVGVLFSPFTLNAEEVQEVLSPAQFNKALGSGKLVVADFFATWCPPCKALKPILEKVAKNNPGVHVLKIDVDKVGSLAAQYGVSSIPDVRFFKGGKQVDRLVGLHQESAYQDYINKHK